MTNDDEAKEVQHQMSALRRDLVFAVDEVSATARQWKDWRFYIHRFPWASAAVVLTAGFLLVPRRNPIVSPDPDQLARLARRAKLVLAPESKQRSRDSITSKLVGMALMAAMRAAMAYMGEKMGGVPGPTPTSPQPSQSVSRMPK